MKAKDILLLNNAITQKPREEPGFGMLHIICLLSATEGQQRCNEPGLGECVADAEGCRIHEFPCEDIDDDCDNIEAQCCCLL